jgi:hypothetical protein
VGRRDLFRDIVVLICGAGWEFKQQLFRCGLRISTRNIEILQLQYVKLQRALYEIEPPVWKCSGVVHTLPHHQNEIITMTEIHCVPASTDSFERQ